MAIVVKCPNPACGKEHSLADDLAGKTYQCPACQQAFRVPVPGYVTEALPPSQVAADHVPRPATPPADQSEAEVESVSDKTKPIGAVPSKALGDGTSSAVHMAEPASMPPKPGVPYAPDPLIGRRLGRYRIDALVGRGGMGRVYKAYNYNLQKPCAIKILPAEFAAQDHSYIDRFLREARSAASISHTNILPVHDVAMEGGLYYIEMEYVDGGSLADKLKREGKLHLRAAVRMTRDVASALLAAHRKGIIHRDIKPSNVLLNKEGHIFVTDFGLAKLAQARTHLTQSGEFLGTPMYMAPEQVWAKEAGHRSDIYSLGVMFYEMLAGRPPYMADTTLGLLDQHRSAPIPDVTQANAEVPAQVGKIIQKMMAKRPEERYSSCEQVVMELNTYLETGEPGLVVDEATLRAMDEAKRSARLGKVFPKPSSPRKPLKINWRLAIPLVLVLVLVLVLGAVAVYFTRQAQRSEVRGQRLGTATTAPSVIQHPVSSIPKLNPP